VAVDWPARAFLGPHVNMYKRQRCTPRLRTPRAACPGCSQSATKRDWTKRQEKHKGFHTWSGHPLPAPPRPAKRPRQGAFFPSFPLPQHCVRAAQLWPPLAACFSRRCGVRLAPCTPSPLVPGPTLPGSRRSGGPIALGLCANEHSPLAACNVPLRAPTPTLHGPRCQLPWGQSRPSSIHARAGLDPACGTQARHPCAPQAHIAERN
jgi:hypothetical protein